MSNFIICPKCHRVATLITEIQETIYEGKSVQWPGKTFCSECGFALSQQEVEEGLI